MAISLDQVDPGFTAVYQTLFGDAIDVREAFEISKFAPQGSDVSTHSNPKKEKRLAQAGLAGAGLAGVAGSHGLYLSAKKYGKDLKPSNFKKPAAPKTGQLMLDGMENVATKGGSPRKKAAVAAGIGAGFIGLHVAELGADALGARALNNQRKQAKEKLKKDYSEASQEIVKAYKLGMISKAEAIERAVSLTEEISKIQAPWLWPKAVKNVATTTQVFARTPTSRVAGAGKRVNRLRPIVRAKERAMVAEHNAQSATQSRAFALRLTAVGAAGGAGTVAYKKGKKKGVQDALNGNVSVAKNDQVDYGFRGEISKVDSEKRHAFGWCSLSEVDGEKVIDLQNDYAPIDEIEKSAYAYVLTSRVGGDMHAREGEKARHTSDLIESFIATPEKLEKMGVPAEVSKSIPTGWWVGFKVNDDEQWEMVKDGRRAGFSIHGKGSRVSKVLD